MRRLPLLLALVLLLLAPLPAGAKGAIEVTVSGPGIEDRSLGYTPRESDVDLQSLADSTNFYGIYGSGQFLDEADVTEDALGPRYTLTWDMGTDVPLVSHVYPFADGGAWAFVPDGQAFFDMPVEGGWWPAAPALTRQLERLGAEQPTTTGVEPTAASSESGAPTDRTPYVVGAAIALLLAVAGLALGRLRSARRVAA